MSAVSLLQHGVDALSRPERDKSQIYKQWLNKSDESI